MENLFFDLQEDFEHAASQVFKALGITSYEEGDSVNAYGGIYSSFSVFGVNIKLELNAYDYEEEYKYMISVYKDVLSEVKVEDNVIEAMAKIVGRLIANNLLVKVAHEISEGFHFYYPEE